MNRDISMEDQLPAIVFDYIKAVVKKVRYRRKTRQEVYAELIDHFYLALKDCATDDQKQQMAEKLIAEFGDPKVLAGLIRRGKNRCRPFWLKVSVAALKVVGVLLLLVVLRCGYLSVGTPVVSVDYVVWFNDFMRQGRDESLNANPYYERAVELGDVDVPESLELLLDGDGDITADNVKEVRAYVEQMAPAFAALRQGAGKPYCWPIYNVDESEIDSMLYLPSSLVDVRGPYWGQIKKLAIRMTHSSIPLKLHDGDVGGAIDDSIAIVRLGQHMEGRGLFMEQLVGIAVEALGVYSFDGIIKTEQVSPEILAKCQRQLEGFAGDDNISFDIRGEKVFQLDLIQRTFTDDGEGNGRALWQGLAVAAKNKKQIATGFVMGNYPDRQQTTASVEKFYEESNRLMNLAPWQMPEEEFHSATAVMMEDVNMYLKIQGATFIKVSRLSWRAMTMRRAIIAVCGVLRYEKDRGEFPADLQAVLNAGYIKNVPIDPFSGKPFVYRLTEESFIFYSLGLDMTDDGGMPYINRNSGRPGQWGDGPGDAVFWPELKGE